MPLPAYEKLGAFYLGRTVDPASGKDRDDLILYDSRDLTTHAVCVGMTGSGKTGLCLGLLEEAAIDGVPAIAIDPKGDIANLMLTFPNLAAADFAPWVDEAEAARAGQTREAFADTTARKWRSGLADWNQDGERIARLKASADFALYTPGSKAGRGLSVLKSFEPPDAALLADSAALKDRLTAAAGSILGLAGIDADPFKSREHILLTTLLDYAWQRGASLDLPGLIQGVQKPPVDKVGVFDVETFYPAKERLGLAMALNNVLAAPGFAAWLEGEPLDIQRLLYTADGKPRVAIISIAHLNDAERMFIVTLLLNELVGWMRRQSGTSSLRALFYMDEIFGYFPPSALPPSKIPLLTLMKQARAFGLGVVLATQNPVDLDYKGLSNAGTWFIGRLQTERDKARVIEGLLSAGDSGTDQATLERMIANLTSRVFLMRNAHEDAAVLMRTRWTLSYVRGPLTLTEIQSLRQPAAVEMKPSSGSSAAAKAGSRRPVLPAGVDEVFLRGEAASNSSDVTYVPCVAGVAKIHFIDSASGVDAWVTRSYIASLDDAGTAPDWSAAAVVDDLKTQMADTVSPTASFADAPAAVLRASNYATWSKQLAETIYQSPGVQVLQCTGLKLSSTPNETEGDFRARLAQALRERRDMQMERLRQSYAAKLNSLQDQLARAAQRTERERSQLTQQKVQTAISIGTTILGAFFGRKTLSAANVNRAGSAVRTASRISRESEDVNSATASAETIQQRLNDTQTQLDAELAKVQAALDPQSIALATVSVKPRKSDTVVSRIALAWKPV
jgi:hypothetical protein